MKQVTIPVTVYVLEASDVESVTDEARVKGTLNDAADAISAALPSSPNVACGLRSHPRLGTTAWARVDGHKLEVGDGVAFHPSFGTVAISELLLLDSVEELPPPRSLSSSREPAPAPRPEAPVDAVEAPPVAKKTTKKAAKKK